MRADWIQYPGMPLAALDDQQQLTDRVCAALREAITNGRLAPEERIKQEQVAAEPAGAVERLAAEHRAIAQAFAAADAARVRALVHDHVRAAGSDALERLPGHEDHEAEEIS